MQPIGIRGKLRARISAIAHPNLRDLELVRNGIHEWYQLGRKAAIRSLVRTPFPALRLPAKRLGMNNLVYVLNGPNLNLLGTREPEIYGTTTLDDIAGQLEDRARELGLEIEMRQTNHEGMLVDWLHEAQAEGARAVLLNAAAYTHTSIALLDAIKAIRTPVVEVHLSDPKTRESFRHVSYVGMAAAMTVEGHGADSYRIALEAVASGQV